MHIIPPPNLDSHMRLASQALRLQHTKGEIEASTDSLGGQDREHAANHVSNITIPFPTLWWKLPSWSLVNACR